MTVKNTQVSNSIFAERSLFRAVILQALLDAVSNSKRTENILQKKLAQIWFDIDNKDFLAVCELAELSPFWVVRNAQIAIANKCKRVSKRVFNQNIRPLN